jgi:hypothetical protein
VTKGVDTEFKPRVTFTHTKKEKMKMYVKQVQSNHYYSCSFVNWRSKTKNLHEKKVIKIMQPEEKERNMKFKNMSPVYELCKLLNSVL